MKTIFLSTLAVLIFLATPANASMYDVWENQDVGDGIVELEQPIKDKTAYGLIVQDSTYYMNYLASLALGTDAKKILKKEVKEHCQSVMGTFDAKFKILDIKSKKTKPRKLKDLNSDVELFSYYHRREVVGAVFTCSE